MPKHAEARRHCLPLAAFILAAATAALAGCTSGPETAAPQAPAPAAEAALPGAAAAPDASPTVTAPSGPVVTLAAHLDGLGEVPPNMMSGTGDATVTYERRTQQMRFKLAYAGLSGGATAAHFHGPAAPDANGPAVVAIRLPANASASQGSAEGQATLTDRQAADLLAGRWYVNIHTDTNPGGEIRGQVLPQQR